MVYIDLTDRKNREQAVASGYIWSAPLGAIKAALADIAAGAYPAPDYIPPEYEGLARSLGVNPAQTGGMPEGSGPA